MSIKWKYCECGCHQSECKIGNRSFSVFIGLTEYKRDEPMRITGCHLFEPSHSYTKIGTFPDMEAVNKFLEPIVTEQIKVLSSKVKELKKLSKGISTKGKDK